MITMNSYKSKKYTFYNGIALVAVLAILVVLAVLAASFSTLMSIEQKSANTNVAKVQADLCAKAGLEHAISLLWTDYIQQPAWDDKSELWYTSFIPLKNDISNSTDIDGLNEKENDAQWIYVRDSNGSIIGRYAVLIEDENSKINVNSAVATSTNMQNQGVGTFEILLTDGNNRGLPISLKSAKKIIRFRYGRDKKPGQANVDDNFTESEFQSDEIDNNGNGLIDELNEGIDEPQEYNPLSPSWDDKAYSSIHELTDSIFSNIKNKLKFYRFLRKYATTKTYGRDIYWDEQNETWRNQINLNVATKKQIHKILKRANKVSRFESSSKNLRNLTSNIIDYHDENNVLSTMGSDYGVEAVCFNEIMANNGSYSLEAEGYDPSDSRKYGFVHRLGIWFNLTKSKSWKFGWPIKRVGRPNGPGKSVLLNGKPTIVPNTTTVEIKQDMVRPVGASRYAEFKSILRSIGGIPNGIWKNAWLKLHRKGKSDLYYPIINNKGYVLTIGYDNNAKNTYSELTNTLYSSENSVRIDSLWRPGPAAWCVFPQMSDLWAFPTTYDKDITPKKNLYYYFYIGEQNFPGNIGNQNEFPFRNVRNTPWKGYNRFLDVDGEPISYSESLLSGKKIES